MRKIFFIFSIFLFCIYFSATVAAYDTSHIENEIDISSFIDVIPEEIKKYIPEDVFLGENVQQISESINLSNFFYFLLNTLSSLIAPTSKKLISLISIIVAVTILDAVKYSFSSDFVCEILNYISLLVLSVCLYDCVLLCTSRIKLFIDVTGNLMNMLLPAMTLLYTLGGNVASAVVNSASVAFFTTLINIISSNLLFPIINLCFGLSLAGNVSGVRGLNGIAQNIKNFFTFIITTLLATLSTVLLFKSNIALSADELTARTVKFAGSFIPVIGSVVGDSVKSVISVFELVKKSVGFIGIIIILIITIPILFELILNKFYLSICSSLSELSGMSENANLIKEVSSVFNYAIALTTTFSLLFILEISIFIQASLAFG